MTTRERRLGGHEDPANSTFGSRRGDRAGQPPQRRPRRGLRAGVDAEGGGLTVVRSDSGGDSVRRLPTGGRVTTEEAS